MASIDRLRKTARKSERRSRMKSWGGRQRISWTTFTVAVRSCVCPAART